MKKGERNRRYYWQNRERILAQKREYDAAHKEEHNARARERARLRRINALKFPYEVAEELEKIRREVMGE